MQVAPAGRPLVAANGPPLRSAEPESGTQLNVERYRWLIGSWTKPPDGGALRVVRVGGIVAR